MTPRSANVRLDVRGFHRKDDTARDLLERVGLAFLAGFSSAARAGGPDEVERSLAALPRQFRGFAYEGAAMALALLDALSLRRGRRRIDGLLSGPALDNVYIAHCGIGWALARLPRFLWSRVTAPDPLLRWLVLDGYGFHQAYFHTRAYVRRQRPHGALPWPAGGPHPYAARAADQGVGRALWFVGGADPRVVAEIVERFPEDRRPDLYAGVGLAATYAGGADAAELRELRRRAGAHRAQLAQGSAFAATARVRAGLVVPHTGLATDVLCGLDPAAAADLCERVKPSSGPDAAGVPAYEVWRRRTAEQVVSIGRC
jgi:hypothetical protein